MQMMTAMHTEDSPNIASYLTTTAQCFIGTSDVCLNNVLLWRTPSPKMWISYSVVSHSSAFFHEHFLTFVIPSHLFGLDLADPIQRQN
ncbi:hypothetical protein A0J61_06750 [Choanephora cucurbitarum]|uniref:Uncharacterized protein n=1 Tax=Choanephora cucurbitarum TaxID=101091 RepID=A0A1C7N991_9FUNG|nr:hypothetical protein A0J61_06750 [Choanephora cucurbitarum]